MFHHNRVWYFDCFFGRILLILFFAVSLLIFPSNSYAWSWRNFHLASSVNYENGFDDNINYQKSGKRSAYTNVIGPDYQFTYAGERLNIQSQGDIKGRLYYGESKFDDLSEDITSKVKYDLAKRIKIELQHVFQHYKEPRSIAASLGAIGGRYSYYINQFEGGVIWQVAKKLTARFREQAELFYFSKSSMSDSIMQRSEVEIAREFGFKSALFATYEFTRRDFFGQFDSMVNYLFWGVRHRLTKSIRVEVRGGVAWVDSAGKNYMKPSFDASAFYNVAKQTDLGLSFRFRPDTNPYNPNIFDYWQTVFSVRQAVRKRLRVIVDLAYGRGEFSGIHTRSALFTVNPKIRYDLDRWVSFELGTTNMIASSNEAVNEFTRNYYYFKISAHALKDENAWLA